MDFHRSFQLTRVLLLLAAAVLFRQPNVPFFPVAPVLYLNSAGRILSLPQYVCFPPWPRDWFLPVRERACAFHWGLHNFSAQAWLIHVDPRLFSRPEEIRAVRRLSFRLVQPHYGLTAGFFSRMPA